jgi:transcription elongation factor Elf1
MGYNCPVCGYDELEKQPYDEKGNESFVLCVCCGFEFGVDDMLYTFESYRKEWLANGAKWLILTTRQSDDWNPDEQLKNIEKIKPMYIPFHQPPKP